MRRSAQAVRIALITVLAAPGLAVAWSADVHAGMTERALAALDDDLPRLSEEARSLMVRASQQPDMMRPREFELLRDIEAARHYINLERLADQELPDSLVEFVKLLTRLSEDEASDIRPDWQFRSVGTLPYALTESTQRLAVLFAQLRQRPGDSELTAMAMVVAGAVAHYAQDLCQPLHTTIHHDGRVDARGVSTRSGIHLRVDRIPGRLPLVIDRVVVRPSRDLGPVLSAVIDALNESHSMVDEVYRRQHDIRQVEEGEGASAALERFVAARFVHSVNLTADLMHTAWRLSLSVDVPAWAAPRAVGD